MVDGPVAVMDAEVEAEGAAATAFASTWVPGSMIVGNSRTSPPVPVEEGAAVEMQARAATLGFSWFPTFAVVVILKPFCPFFLRFCRLFTRTHLDLRQERGHL